MFSDTEEVDKASYMEYRVSVEIVLSQGASCGNTICSPPLLLLVLLLRRAPGLRSPSRIRRPLASEQWGICRRRMYDGGG